MTAWVGETGEATALTGFQVEVARLFFSLPASDLFLLAGGAALLAQQMATRPTQDLDFFTRCPVWSRPPMEPARASFVGPTFASEELAARELLAVLDRAAARDSSTSSLCGQSRG